ncbi:MAG: UbiH/UbiF/VisC/COQ6 family ubiquinone biosynthesis hydroxylase [Agarilytica sp.]
MPTKKVDIAIVGGGVIGLTMANLLKGMSANVLLIDGGAAVASINKHELEKIDPRVLAISKKSEAIFKKIGVWDAVLNTRACAYEYMHVWDGEGTANIEFDAQSTGEENLGHIVENKVLVNALSEALKNAGATELLYEAKVERFECEDEVSYLELDSGDLIQASLVIAADGAHSRLRELASFESKEWDYGHTAIVTTVTTAKPHKNTAWQVFRSAGPLALLPIHTKEKDQSQCSIVWSVKHDIAERLMEKDDQGFSSELEKYFESKLGNIVSVDKRYAFPLKQRHAKHYCAPGVILVGDAAHTIHPLAGQGANIGFYDVDILAQEVMRAEKRALPFSNATIGQRYQCQRQGENLVAMASMEGFKRIFASDDLTARWLRNEGLRMVNRIPFLKNTFSAVASGR